MSTFDPTGTGPKDTSGRSQKARREEQLLSDMAKGLDIQHHNTSLLHEFGSAFDAPQTVAPNTSGQGSVGQAPSPARSDHQHGAEVPTFVYPVLLNSWADYGANWLTSRYYKMNGRVWLEGLIRNGSAINAQVLSLNVGYRPPWDMMFATSSNNSWARLNVFANGNVYFEPGIAGNSTGWCWLGANWLAA